MQFFCVLFLAYVNQFTVRCYAERGYATICRQSLHPSVTFRYREHISWSTSKIISRLISLGFLLRPNPTWAIWSNGNTPRIRVE